MEMHELSYLVWVAPIYKSKKVSTLWTLRSHGAAIVVRIFNPGPSRAKSLLQSLGFVQIALVEV